MCFSRASSTIAVQNVKWGLEDHRQYLGNDWTRDEHVWNRFLDELLTIPKLKNIHFMGGETLLTKRFEDLVDFFILHGRFDLCFSFVTNGTTYNQQLINKLKRFTFSLSFCDVGLDKPRAWLPKYLQQFIIA